VSIPGSVYVDSGNSIGLIAVTIALLAPVARPLLHHNVRTPLWLCTSRIRCTPVPQSTHY
jgi:hypothetical protein